MPDMEAQSTWAHGPMLKPCLWKIEIRWLQWPVPKGSQVESDHTVWKPFCNLSFSCAWLSTHPSLLCQNPILSFPYPARTSAFLIIRARLLKILPEGGDNHIQFFLFSATNSIFNWMQKCFPRKSLFTIRTLTHAHFSSSVAKEEDRSSFKRWILTAELRSSTLFSREWVHSFSKEKVAVIQSRDHRDVFRQNISVLIQNHF